MRSRTLLGVLAVTSMLLSGTGSVGAQDATPQASPLASPMAGACDAPALPAGTPTPPEATPGGEAEDTDKGTPETVEAEASPVSPVSTGMPADEATTDEVLTWVNNYANCANAGNAEAVFVLLTDQFLLTTFGTANVYDVITFAEFWPMTIESASDVQTHPDGHVSVDLVYTGLDGPPTQLTHDRWFLIEGDGYLKLDASENLPIAGADVTVEVSVADCGVSETMAQAGDLIAFTVRNNVEYPAGFDVLQLPEGVTFEQFEQDPALGEETQFLGWAFAEPGGTGHRGLINVEPGTYTIDCWIDEPEGAPPAGGGLVAEFIVQ
jgi:hypothetical protein